MGLFDRLRYLLTGRMGDAAGHRMQSRIDSATTSDENRRHWANADHLSADASFNPGVRQTLRNRARYETLNNCYAKSIVRSSADDLIGTGPRLQLSIPGDDDGTIAKEIERSFAMWSDASQHAIKLRIAEQALVNAGESFGIFGTNPRLRHPVQFDVLWVEAEMCASPYGQQPDPRRIDGIDFDDFGCPVTYWFLKYHPGGLVGMTTFSLQDFYSVPAERVVHWYACDRPGQHRGIPEITPALGLYGQLRRYTLARLTAAEFASCLAGVMKAAGASAGPEITSISEWTPIEMVRGALLTLPEGWEASQFRSENPPTGYGEFKRELLNESGRATGQPLNIVTGNSSGYNYSSGRLDHLPYQRRIRIKRNDLRLKVLDPIFREWWNEAKMVMDIIPAGVELDACRWCWNWDGFDSIDQNKDAMADDTRLKNGTSTYAEILAEYGQDWTEVFAQIAKEKALAEKLGLPWPLVMEGGAGSASGKRPTGDQGSFPSSPEGRALISPRNVQQAVLAALEEAEIGDDMVRDVMEYLAPAFAALQPTRNGTY